MSEDMNKNEEATPHKLIEARRKGQVSKSQELSSFFSTMGMLVTFIAIMGSSLSYITHHTAWWLKNADVMSQDNSVLWKNLLVYLQGLSFIVLPIILTGVILSIVATLVHIGPLLTFYPLKPDFKKLNPITGLKKIFALKSLVDVVRMLLKITAFISVAYMVLRSGFSKVLSSNVSSIYYLLQLWASTLVTLIFAMLAVFLLFAVFDLWYSKREFAKQMRMSIKDIKDEHKNQDGNPEVKGKRKEAQKELLSKSTSINHVKDSDVIVTNPTHVAIALMYRPMSMALPVVVAKGQGLFASSIRNEAKKHGIPIVRKPELARALLKSIKIGNPIDKEQQTQVADVYRWVITLEKNKVVNK